MQSVTDATNNAEGFKDGNTTGDDYVYDSFGNITQDKNKGITNVKYNHLNLPTEVVFNTGKINYTYDAAGTRLSKKVQPTGGALITTDYVNGFQYENNILQFFPHPEGYVKRNANNTYLYAYQYKDHLGNVRLSYADVNKNGTIEPASEILEENNYYPFGLKHKGYNNIANSNRSEGAERYKFNGMEWQPELGLDLYDFGARNYDPAIGRWLNVDPLAEEMRRFSPYNYAFNSPVMFVDPDGMMPFLAGSYGQNLSGSAVEIYYFGDEGLTGEKTEGNDGQSNFGNKNEIYNKIDVKNNSDENTDIAFNDINENSSYQDADVSSSAVMGIGSIIQFIRVVAKIVAKSYKAASKGKIAKGASNVSVKASKQFNSVENVIENAGKLKRLKGGVREGSIQGNADEIFKGLAQQYGAKVQTVGRETFFTSGNIRVGIHNSAKGGGTPTIHIKNAGQLYKIRVTQ